MLNPAWSHRKDSPTQMMLKASLIYRVSSRTARTVSQRNHVLQNVKRKSSKMKQKTKTKINKQKNKEKAHEIPIDTMAHFYKSHKMYNISDHNTYAKHLREKEKRKKMPRQIIMRQATCKCH